MPLTLKRRRFAKYYAMNGNATQAVFDAGYKPKSRTVATVMGCELMKDPAVKQEVEGWESYVQDQINPSIETLVRLRNESKSGAVQLRAALTLLELAGVGTR